MSATETLPAPAPQVDLEPTNLDVEGELFMRGLLVGLALSSPFWAVVVALIVWWLRG